MSQELPYSQLPLSKVLLHQCFLCGKTVEIDHALSLEKNPHLWDLIPPHIRLAKKDLPVTDKNVCISCYEKLQEWCSFTGQPVNPQEEIEALHKIDGIPSEVKLQPESDSPDAISQPARKSSRKEQAEEVEEVSEIGPNNLDRVVCTDFEVSSTNLRNSSKRRTKKTPSPPTPKLTRSSAKTESGATTLKPDAVKEKSVRKLVTKPKLDDKPAKQSRFTIHYLREKLNRPITDEEELKLTEFIGKGNDRGIYNYLMGGGSKQLWDCQICNLPIKGTMTEVVSHYSQEHNSKPIFICKLCGKKITSIHTFMRHRQSHLIEVKCPDCGKVFADRSKLYMHKPMHSENRPYICSECGRGYKMLSHLKTHKERAHIPDGQKSSFTCEFCGKTFTVRSNLSTHISQTHNKNRHFVCDICGKVLKAKQALDCHLKSHAGIKSFQCELCDDKFSSKASLSAHIRRHTGEKPYTCKECGKNFTNRSARTSHMQFVHNTERKFVCEVCGKGFKVQRDLRIHGSVHTGEKPFVCICGKTFRAGANYYAHRRIHKKQAESEGASTSLPEESELLTGEEVVVTKDPTMNCGAYSMERPMGLNSTQIITRNCSSMTEVGTANTDSSNCVFVPYAIVQTTTPTLAIIGYPAS